MKPINRVVACALIMTGLITTVSCESGTETATEAAPESVATVRMESAEESVASTIQECALLTSDELTQVADHRVVPTHIYTHPAGDGWMTECRYDNDEPTSPRIGVYVDQDWQETVAGLEKQPSENYGATAKPVRGLGEEAWAKTVNLPGSKTMVTVLARQGNAAVLITDRYRERVSDPLYVPIQTARLGLSRIPRQARVTTDDTGSTCGKARRAARTLLESEVIGAREFHPESHVITCTFSGSSGEVGMTISTKTDAKMGFEGKSLRPHGAEHPAVADRGVPGRYRMSAGNGRYLVIDFGGPMFDRPNLTSEQRDFLALVGQSFEGNR